MINLLPDELRSARTYGRRMNVIFFASLTLVGIALVGVAIVLSSLLQMNRQERELSSEIELKKQSLAEAAKIGAEIERLNKAVIVIDKAYTKSVIFSELIPKIGSTLPPGSFITGLTLDESNNKAFELTINIDKQLTAAVAQQNLISSGVFAFADINRISPPAENGKYTDVSIKSAFSEDSGFVRKGAGTEVKQ